MTLNPLIPLAKNFGELRRFAAVGPGDDWDRVFYIYDVVSAADAALSRRNDQGTEPGQERWQSNKRPRPRLTDGRRRRFRPKKHNQLDELWIATLVAMLGFGVGAGCGLAGKLSGSRLELGLVPFGTMLLILLTIILGFVARPPPEVEEVSFGHCSATAARSGRTMACLVAIGLAAGLYIVPLYTLLQHRAPKDSKGNMVATSNFVNVTGGLLAVLCSTA